MNSYKHDIQFLSEHGIETVQLQSANGHACVMVIPAWQGRVMTSSAAGINGDSFGWINYDYIAAGSYNDKFNPVGGEERFWLGPEGGPFSIYFDDKDNQTFDRWNVPAILDTIPFDVDCISGQSVSLSKEASLKNASGFTLDVKMSRTVLMLTRSEVARDFGIAIPEEADIVAYRTNNTIANVGQEAWNATSGMLSVWMLGMFNPSPSTTVFIPYREDGEGDIVKTDYFGTLPADRISADNGIIYFKIDGKLRSKIGLSPSRATGLCGSYDSQSGVLTILSCTLPEAPMPYLNAQWGKQDNPLAGDMINSYNDGPVEDGSIMGPFYEIETSSPGAPLAPGESLTHTQQVIHIQASESVIAPIVKHLFNADLEVIKNMF